ncbi:MAG: FHA domain-containing protein [Thermodesulfobacteriota bacterium]
MEPISLFEQKEFPFSGLDELFRNMSGEMADGYALATGGEETRLLFIVTGKPYSASVEDARGGKLTPVKDFFEWYKARSSAAIEFFEVDRKVLLGMLVRRTHRPLQSLTADLVDLEEMTEQIESGEKEVILALVEKGTERGFAMFVEGKLAFVSLLEKGKDDEDEPSLERLISYTSSKGRDLTVEVYNKTTVAPAEDSAPLPKEGIATFHGKGLPEPPEEIPEAEEAPEAYIELVEDGKVKGTFPLEIALTVGRDDTNDIPIKVPGVAHEHAVVKKTEDGYFIEDLKSTIGTFFKGIRIETKELHDGDEITIKAHILRFHGPSGDAPPSPPSPPSPAPSPESPPVPAKEEEKEKEKIPRAVHTTAFVLDDGTEFPLGSVTTIGSGDDADIKLQGVMMARKHAVVVRGKDIFKIIKKGTLAPLKINGEKAEEHVLKDGDVVEVGGHTLTFRMSK